MNRLSPLVRVTMRTSRCPVATRCDCLGPFAQTLRVERFQAVAEYGLCLALHRTCQAASWLPRVTSEFSQLPITHVHQRLLSWSTTTCSCALCSVSGARSRPTLIVYGGTIQPGHLQNDIPSLGRKAGDQINVRPHPIVVRLSDLLLYR